jgi:hypothetical protein
MYGPIGDAAMNSAGHVAFAGSVVGISIPEFNGKAIFQGPAGDVHRVVRAGEAAPGGGGTVFSDFGNPSINEAAWLAFTAILSGPGVSTANDRGIWVRDGAGQLHLIAREGNALDTGGGTSRTILSLDMFEGAAAGEDGFASAFNNAGQVAFRATFTDGSSGVFVASVPEPAGGVLLVGAALLCRRSRFRRRAK